MKIKIRGIRKKRLVVNEFANYSQRQFKVHIEE